MRERLRAAIVFASALGLLGCSQQPTGATAVVLRVDADAEIKSAMRALALRISREGADGQWELHFSRDWEIDGRFAWPAELSIVPADAVLRTFEVIVEAHAADGRTLAGTRAVASFTSGEITALGLYLELKCYMLSMPCEPMLPPTSDSMVLVECHGPTCKTCRAGQCVDTSMSMLPPYRTDEGVRELFESSIEGPPSAGSGGRGSSGSSGSSRGGGSGGKGSP